MKEVQLNSMTYCCWVFSRWWENHLLFFLYSPCPEACLVEANRTETIKYSHKRETRKPDVVSHASKLTLRD